MTVWRLSACLKKPAGSDPAGRDDAAAERTFGSDENSREPQYSGDHAFCQKPKRATRSPACCWARMTTSKSRIIRQNFLARVQAQLRRYKAYGGSHPAAEQKADEIVNGGLTLDMRQKLLFVDGEAVRLTVTEYKITELLMRHIGQVFSAAQIYEKRME